MALAIIIFVPYFLLLAVGSAAIFIVFRYRRMAEGCKKQVEVFKALLNNYEDQKYEQFKLVPPKKAKKADKEAAA